ncbi:MAG: hypothetical protein P9M00_12740 [Candidatus Tritonobacter lacicola]|nr:hypothetical protein [Candidatus Tritonobacter lacicola]
MKTMVKRAACILLAIFSIAKAADLRAAVDFDQVITKKFKKELQAVNSKKAAGNLVKQYATEWFGISKDVIGLLSDVASITDDNLLSEINEVAGGLGMELTAYSLAGDIYKGFDGDDMAKVSAIKNAYSIGQTLLYGGIKPLGVEGVGWGALSTAMFAVGFIDYSLTTFMTTAIAEYEEAWYMAYEDYLNWTYGGTKNMKGWVALAESKDGGKKIEERLFEFWDQDILVILGESQQARGGVIRTISRDASILANEKAHKSFAARYWSENFQQAFKGHAQKQALDAKIYAEQEATYNWKVLKKLLEQIKFEKVQVEPARKTISVGEIVIFEAIAKYSRGLGKVVTDSARWSGGKDNIFIARAPGSYAVSATYEGVTGHAIITVLEGDKDRLEGIERVCAENKARFYQRCEAWELEEAHAILRSSIECPWVKKGIKDLDKLVDARNLYRRTCNENQQKILAALRGENLVGAIEVLNASKGCPWFNEVAAAVSEVCESYRNSFNRACKEGNLDKARDILNKSQGCRWYNDGVRVLQANIQALVRQPSQPQTGSAPGAAGTNSSWVVQSMFGARTWNYYENGQHKLKTRQPPGNIRGYWQHGRGGWQYIEYGKVKFVTTNPPPGMPR